MWKEYLRHFTRQKACNEPQVKYIGAYIKIVWQSCPQQSKACIQNILHIHKWIQSIQTELFILENGRGEKKNSNGAEFV